jgi:hypothetical protein
MLETKENRDQYRLKQGRSRNPNLVSLHIFTIPTPQNRVILSEVVRVRTDALTYVERKPQVKTVPSRSSRKYSFD